jgi:hypothetical protein
MKATTCALCGDSIPAGTLEQLARKGLARMSVVIYRPVKARATFCQKHTPQEIGAWVQTRIQGGEP